MATMIPPSEMLGATILPAGTPSREPADVPQCTIAFVLSVGVTAARSCIAAARCRVLDPLLASYYAVPFFALYPLFVVIFGPTTGP